MAFGFSIVALAGLMAAAPIGMAFRTLADRQTRVTERGPPARWRIAIIWFLAAIASLAVFGLLFLGVLLWVSQGVPILKESADQLVWRRRLARGRARAPREGKCWRRAQKRGQHMGRSSKLTDVQKAEARRRRAEGATLAELARSYHVGKSTISRLGL